MATYDNTYSRVVAWMKIILPLLALAILSTLFLVARTIDPAQNLPFADVDVDELAREQRIGQPDYSSVTADGAAISLSAESARPDPNDPNRIDGTAIRAAIDMPGGGRIDIDSQRMQIDNTAGLAKLRDGVVVRSDDGITLTSETLDIALDSTRFESDTPVRLEGPAGTLTADRFQLTGNGSASQPYVLVFKGHVKLIYDLNE